MYAYFKFTNVNQYINYLYQYTLYILRSDVSAGKIFIYFYVSAGAASFSTHMYGTTVPMYV
jgi:hypothetical protein